MALKSAENRQTRHFLRNYLKRLIKPRFSWREAAYLWGFSTLNCLFLLLGLPPPPNKRVQYVP
jgi:hypothetical protein